MAACYFASVFVTVFSSSLRKDVPEVTAQIITSLICISAELHIRCGSLPYKGKEVTELRRKAIISKMRVFQLLKLDVLLLEIHNNSRNNRNHLRSENFGIWTC